MKNLLFISTYPFPIDMGSKQHAFYFLKALSNIYNVYCIFFIPPKNETPSNVEADLNGIGVKAYEICHFKKPSNEIGYGRFLKNIIAFPNFFTRMATHPQGVKVINSFIERYSITIVHFEHFWYTKYAFHIHSNAKAVIVYHDMHHDIYRQRASLEKKYQKKALTLIEYFKCLLFENMLEKKVALKVFLNPEEMLSFPKKSVHIPHVANSNIKNRPVRNTNYFNILFIGSYNHPPNRRSVRFIIHHVLPRLGRLHNNFMIHLIGRRTENCSNLLDGSPFREHVTIHGFKSDINDAFVDMDIALFPILDGGGIKTKIIDALASGVPIVTTPLGINGMNHESYNCIGVGATPDEIVSEMVKLMQSVSLRRTRSESGIEFIEREHSFRALSEKLASSYSKL